MTVLGTNKATSVSNYDKPWLGSTDTVCSTQHGASTAVSTQECRPAIHLGARDEPGEPREPPHLPPQFRPGHPSRGAGWLETAAIPPFIGVSQSLPSPALATLTPNQPLSRPLIHLHLLNLHFSNLKFPPFPLPWPSGEECRFRLFLGLCAARFAARRNFPSGGMEGVQRDIGECIHLADRRGVRVFILGRGCPVWR